jgi:flagellar M-ring protein FliF
MPASLTQLTELWRRLRTGQRLAVAAAAASTLGLIIALAIYGSQPEYGVLFADLKPADAQMIIEKLKAANVPYRLSQGGTAVSAPSERVAELRLQMAASGALSGGHVGFDIFDKSNFGTTDFAQRVNYQRALAGELARTLEGMDEVETARVHLAQPRESIFIEKAEQAKASVVLRMRQGRELSRERTEAVINLVASAVEGLDPGDVSVMDTRGRLLSSPGRSAPASGGAARFNSHLEARHKLESETASRIVSLLEPITGVGHVRADVAADLDFSQIEQTEEKYDPKSAVIRSQQKSDEFRRSASGGLGGVVGARANDPATGTPPAAATTPAPVPLGDQRSSSTTHYEIDKTVKRIVGGGGRLTRLSASVVVDYKQVNGAATARAPEELKKIQDLVAAAIGLDTSRGDQIVVQTIPFDQPAVETSTPSWLERHRDLVRTGIKYGGLALAALVLVIFVIRPAKRALKSAAQSSSLLVPAAPAPALAAAGQSRVSDVARKRDGTLLSAGLPAPEPTDAGQLTQPAAAGSGPRTVAELEAEMAQEAAPQVQRANEIKRHLIERGKQEPEMVAMTIRGWLQERRS